MRDFISFFNSNVIRIIFNLGFHSKLIFYFLIGLGLLFISINRGLADVIQKNNFD